MEDRNIVKILVIGKQGSEKTDFIYNFCEQHSPAGFHYDNKATVYHCQLEIKGESRRVWIFDIPADDLYRSEHLLIMNSNNARFILTYFVDKPSSFRLLPDFWSSMMFYERSLEPVIVVGLKTDPEAEKSLAVDNKCPVKREDAESKLSKPHIKKFFECSSDNLKEVTEAFTFLLNCELPVRSFSSSDED